MPIISFHFVLSALPPPLVTCVFVFCLFNVIYSLAVYLIHDNMTDTKGKVTRRGKSCAREWWTFSSQKWVEWGSYSENDGLPGYSSHCNLSTPAFERFPFAFSLSNAFRTGHPRNAASTQSVEYGRSRRNHLGWLFRVPTVDLRS